jgi:hypothetical protein
MRMHFQTVFGYIAANHLIQIYLYSLLRQMVIIKAPTQKEQTLKQSLDLQVFMASSRRDTQLNYIFSLQGPKFPSPQYRTCL